MYAELHCDTNALFGTFMFIHIKLLICYMYIMKVLIKIIIKNYFIRNKYLRVLLCFYCAPITILTKYHEVVRIPLFGIYIIGHYNPSVRIIDLVSHNTYDVCVNFICKLRGLQFNVESEPQIF